MIPLRDIGEALYGPRWVRPLADALGNDRRLVQRWNAGTEPIPDGVWRELGDMLQRQSLKTTRLIYAIQARLTTEDRHDLSISDYAAALARPAPRRP